MKANDIFPFDLFEGDENKMGLLSQPFWNG